MQEIDEKVVEIDSKINNINAMITKLSSYGREGVANKITEKTEELQSLISSKEDMGKIKKEILSELKRVNEEYITEKDKLYTLKMALKSHIDSF